MALTSVKQRMAPVPGSLHRQRPAPSGNIQAAKRGPDATQRPSPAWNSDSPHRRRRGHLRRVWQTTPSFRGTCR